MRLTHLLALIATAFLLWAIFFPVFSGSRPISGRARCMSNVKQQSLALVMYAEDSDDLFPPRDAWMDSIGAYGAREEIFHDPEGPKGGYGYAFDGALSSTNARKLKTPETTPMTYDSINPIRNASDLVASLPARGRHPAKEPTSNTIGYADGHAKARRMVP